MSARQSIPSVSLVLLLAACALTAACGPNDQPRRAPTASPTASKTTTPRAGPTAAPTATSAPSGARTLATLQAELTIEPCAAEDVTSYSNAVLPLADQYVLDAVEAKSLAEIDDPDFIGEMYDRAVARRNQLRSVVPPECAQKSHIKMVNAFQLLIAVWDHIGEGEYELARRKLRSSYDEMATAAALLTELEAQLAGR